MRDRRAADPEHTVVSAVRSKLPFHQLRVDRAAVGPGHGPPRTHPHRPHGPPLPRLAFDRTAHRPPANTPHLRRGGGQRPAHLVWAATRLTARNATATGDRSSRVHDPAPGDNRIHNGPRVSRLSHRSSWSRPVMRGLAPPRVVRARPPTDRAERAQRLPAHPMMGMTDHHAPGLDLCLVDDVPSIRTAGDTYRARSHARRGDLRPRPIGPPGRDPHDVPASDPYGVAGTRPGNDPHNNFAPLIPIIGPGYPPPQAASVSPSVSGYPAAAGPVHAQPYQRQVPSPTDRPAPVRRRPTRGPGARLRRLRPPVHIRGLASCRSRAPGAQFDADRRPRRGPQRWTRPTRHARVMSAGAGSFA